MRYLVHSGRRWPFTQRRAVADARGRAEGYAAAAGMRLGPLVRLSHALRKFVHTMSVRAEVLALDHAARPARTLAMLLAVVLTSLIIGIPVGIVAGDTPLWWREGMPGTLLSGAMILAAAITAWLAHRHQRSVVPWHRSFWALSALALTVLAVVELLGVTLACAAASYGVDALWAVGDLEFIIGDGILKATGEPFLVLAYLTAFRDLTTASPVADGMADRGAE